MVRGAHADNGKHSKDYFSAIPLPSSVPTSAGTPFDEDDPFEVGPATRDLERFRRPVAAVAVAGGSVAGAAGHRLPGVTAIAFNQTGARQAGGASSSATRGSSRWAWPRLGPRSSRRST